MLQRLHERFESEELSARERQETIRLLRIISGIILLAAVALIITDGFLDQQPTTITALTPLAILVLISFGLLSRGILWPARLLIPAGIFTVLTYLVYDGAGTHDAAIIAYAIVLILSSLTLGRNATLVFGVLSVMAFVVIGALEINGIIENSGSFLTSWDDLTLWSILFLTTAFLQRLLVGRLDEGLRRARENERIQIQANQELRTLQSELEGRVDERTRELARRTRYLEATTQVAREATATLDTVELLSRVVNLVSEQFGFYHTGLFLVNATREWAELQAASSEGGQRMLARQHRLRVADEGIVGYVTSRGEARIALDTDADTIFLHNPDLPETRSEMALPLRARGEIIGALDVQSTEPDAFTDEDVATLQALADQIALAISNAKLYELAQASLEAERRAYGELSREAWTEMVQQQDNIGYRSSQGVVQAVGTDAGQFDDGDFPAIDIPVRVRGQTIATIQAYKPQARGAWAENETEIVAALADQLGLALEGARMYQDTQRRAAREQVIGEVTGRVREMLDVDTMLQTAVREFSRALGVSEARIRLTPGEELPDVARGNG